LPKFLPIVGSMNTIDSIDWSAFPTFPFPAPDPNGFDANTWLPADLKRGLGYTDYPAGPTLCRVEWLHNKNIRPAYRKEDAKESERYGDFGAGVPDPWASIVYAYQKLPDQRAIESIILGHVPCIHKVVEDWVWIVYERGVTESDDEYFSMALEKVCEIVPSLRKIGQRKGWDDWEVPGHIAPYLSKSVRNYLFQELNEQRKVHEGIIMYLLLERSHPRRIPGMDLHISRSDNLYRAESHPDPPQKNKKKEEKTKGKKRHLLCSEKQQTFVGGGSLVYAEYDDHTPDKILMEKEEAAKRKSFNNILDCVCEDVLDRLLLGMRAARILTEKEMGELYGMGRDAVNRRLNRMHRAMQEELGFDLKICDIYRRQKGIRCSQEPEKRKLAEEVLASWQYPIKSDNYSVLCIAHHHSIHPIKDISTIKSLTNLGASG